jgi:hypothetical protein
MSANVRVMLRASDAGERCTGDTYWRSAATPCGPPLLAGALVGRAGLHGASAGDRSARPGKPVARPDPWASGISVRFLVFEQQARDHAGGTGDRGAGQLAAEDTLQVADALGDLDGGIAQVQPGGDGAVVDDGI